MKGDRIHVQYTAVIGRLTTRKQAIKDLQRWWANAAGNDFQKRDRLQKLLGQELHKDVDNDFCKDMLEFIGCEHVVVGGSGELVA